MSSLEMYFSRSTNVASRTIGDDTLIMSTQDSTVFMLNSVGTAIWNAANGKTPLSQIVHDCICSEFDVSEDEAYMDAKEFANLLAEHGILQISDTPVAVKY